MQNREIVEELTAKSLVKIETWIFAVAASLCRGVQRIGLGTDTGRWLQPIPGQ